MTEVEIIAVNDAMNFIKWVQLFVVDQLWKVKINSLIKKIESKTVVQHNTTQVPYNWGTTERNSVLLNKQDILSAYNISIPLAN